MSEDEKKSSPSPNHGLPFDPAHLLGVHSLAAAGLPFPHLAHLHSPYSFLTPPPAFPGLFGGLGSLPHPLHAAALGHSLATASYYGLPKHPSELGSSPASSSSSPARKGVRSSRSVTSTTAASSSNCQSSSSRSPSSPSVSSSSAAHAAASVPPYLPGWALNGALYPLTHALSASTPEAKQLSAPSSSSSSSRRSRKPSSNKSDSRSSIKDGNRIPQAHQHPSSSPLLSIPSAHIPGSSLDHKTVLDRPVPSEAFPFDPHSLITPYHMSPELAYLSQSLFLHRPDLGLPSPFLTVSAAVAAAASNTSSSSSLAAASSSSSSAKTGTNVALEPGQVVLPSSASSKSTSPSSSLTTADDRSKKDKKRKEKSEEMIQSDSHRTNSHGSSSGRDLDLEDRDEGGESMEDRLLASMSQPYHFMNDDRKKRIADQIRKRVGMQNSVAALLSKQGMKYADWFDSSAKNGAKTADVNGAASDLHPSVIHQVGRGGASEMHHSVKDLSNFHLTSGLSDTHHAGRSTSDSHQKLGSAQEQLHPSLSSEASSSRRLSESSHGLSEKHRETELKEFLNPLVSADHGDSRDGSLLNEHTDMASASGSDSGRSTPESGKRAADGSNDEGSPNKRRCLKLNERELTIPLEHGWNRQTVISGMGRRGIVGEVLYFAPCGKKMKTIPDVMRYLERNPNPDLGRENFSFNTKVNVGSFFEIQSGHGSALVPLSDAEVLEKIEMSRGKRARMQMLARKKREKAAREQALARQIMESKFKRRLELQEMSRRAAEMRFEKRLEQQTQKEMEKKERENKVIEKRKEKEQHKMLKQQERVRIQEQLRKEREMRAQQIIEARNRRQKELEELRLADAVQRNKEREMKRQQLIIMKEQERERRRQHLLLVKALEQRKRQEEKQNQRRVELEVAMELKKPAEDMELKNAKPLPTYPRLKSRLPGRPIADCMMVVEFLNNFGLALSLDKSTIPTLESLERGLLNDSEEDVEDLMSLVMHLLRIALDDLGVPNPKEAVTKLNQKVTEMEMTDSTMSEVLRIFVKARGEKDMSEWLADKPMEALNSTKKAAFLAFLCNELLTSKVIANEIDKHMDAINNLRRDKWIVEGQLRQLRVFQARKFNKIHKSTDRRNTNTANPNFTVGDEDTMSSSKNESDDDDDKDEDDDKEDEEGSGNESDGSSSVTTSASINSNTPFEPVDESMTREESDKKIEKLRKQHAAYRQKVFRASLRLRAINIGQDRYKRTYWILPLTGGVYVEGMESGVPEDYAKENQEVKKEAEISETSDSVDTPGTTEQVKVEKAEEEEAEMETKCEKVDNKDDEERTHRTENDNKLLKESSQNLNMKQSDNTDGVTSHSDKTGGGSVDILEILNKNFNSGSSIDSKTVVQPKVVSPSQTNKTNIVMSHQKSNIEMNAVCSSSEAVHDNSSDAASVKVENVGGRGKESQQPGGSGNATITNSKLKHKDECNLDSKLTNDFSASAGHSNGICSSRQDSSMDNEDDSFYLDDGNDDDELSDVGNKLAGSEATQYHSNVLNSVKVATKNGGSTEAHTESELVSGVKYFHDQFSLKVSCDKTNITSDGCNSGGCEGLEKSESLNEHCSNGNKAGGSNPLDVTKTTDSEAKVDQKEDPRSSKVETVGKDARGIFQSEGGAVDCATAVCSQRESNLMGLDGKAVLAQTDTTLEESNKGIKDKTGESDLKDCTKNLKQNPSFSMEEHGGKLPDSGIIESVKETGDRSITKGTLNELMKEVGSKPSDTVNSAKGYKDKLCDFDILRVPQLGTGHHEASLLNHSSHHKNDKSAKNFAAGRHVLPPASVVSLAAETSSMLTSSLLFSAIAKLPQSSRLGQPQSLTSASSSSSSPPTAAEVSPSAAADFTPKAKLSSKATQEKLPPAAALGSAPIPAHSKNPQPLPPFHPSAQTNQVVDLTPPAAHAGHKPSRMASHLQHTAGPAPLPFLPQPPFIPGLSHHPYGPCSASETLSSLASIVSPPPAHYHPPATASLIQPLSLPVPSRTPQGISQTSSSYPSIDSLLQGESSFSSSELLQQAASQVLRSAENKKLSKLAQSSAAMLPPSSTSSSSPSSSSSILAVSDMTTRDFLSLYSTPQLTSETGTKQQQHGSEVIDQDLWFSILPRMPCDELSLSQPTQTQSSYSPQVYSPLSSAASSLSAVSTYLASPLGLKSQQSHHESLLTSLQLLTTHPIASPSPNTPSISTGFDFMGEFKIPPPPDSAPLVDPWELLRAAQGEAQPIPKSMQHGWWRIYDLAMLRSVMSCTLSRGIREKNLQRAVHRYLDYARLHCTFDSEKGEKDPHAESEEEEKLAQERKKMAIKNKIKKEESATIKKEEDNQSQIDDSGKGTDNSEEDQVNELTAEIKPEAEIKSEAGTSVKEEDVKVEEKQLAVSGGGGADVEMMDYVQPDQPQDWSIKCMHEIELAALEEVEALEERIFQASLQVKQGWRPNRDGNQTLVDRSVTDVSDLESYPLDVGISRLLELEANIERRYLKPPLIRSVQLNLSNISSNSDRGEGEFGDDENVPPGLLLWRQAVVGSESPAQLSLCTQLLAKSISWEKSIMRVTCQICRKDDNEAELLLCDGCDKGYHTYCFKPKMENIPDGDWYCFECVSKASGTAHCVVCGMPGGRILSCRLCPRCVHLECLDPPLPRMPKRWQCVTCVVDKGSSKRSKKRKERLPTVQRITITKLVVKEEPAELDNDYPTTEPITTASAASLSSDCGCQQEEVEAKNGNGGRLASERNSVVAGKSSSPIDQDKRKRKRKEKDTVSSPTPKKKEKVCKKERKMREKKTQEVVEKPKESPVIEEKKSDKELGKDLVLCGKLLTEMEKSENGWPFLKPVNKKQFPSYKKYIKTPMDFSTARAKVKGREYKHRQEFATDMRLIFNNCETFNEDDSEVGQAGYSMRQYFERRWLEMFPDDAP